MTVKGQTYIQAGQVIDFAIRPVEEDGQTSDKKSYDENIVVDMSLQR